MRLGVRLSNNLTGSLMGLTWYQRELKDIGHRLADRLADRGAQPEVPVGHTIQLNAPLAACGALAQEATHLEGHLPALRRAMRARAGETIDDA